MKQIAYLLAGVLVGFILAGAVFIVTRAPAGNPVVLEPPPTKMPIEVQVTGGVARPGVYSLPDGSRVQDAVDAAGGLLAETDVSSVNLAARLQDGQQVQIPGSAPVAAATKPGGSPFTLITTATPRTTSTPISQGHLVDVNTATLAQLETLPGIGPVLAQNIINYRNDYGPFASPEELLNVDGIGPATYDQIQYLITVGP